MLPVRPVMSVCDGLYLPVCWADGFFFVVLLFSSVFFSIGVYVVVPHSWCGVCEDGRMTETCSSISSIK
jgi:hypothetical protein